VCDVTAQTPDAIQCENLQVPQVIIVGGCLRVRFDVKWKIKGCCNAITALDFSQGVQDR
jgi:hypothetical protein